MDNNTHEAVLPHNLDAEQAFLGILFNDSVVLSTLTSLPQSQDFFLERHRYIYDAMYSLSDAGQQVDLISVCEKLISNSLLEKSGGKQYVAQLMDKGLLGASSAQYYAELIIEKSQRRFLIKHAYQMLEHARDESIDINTVLDESEKNIFSVTDRSHKSLYYPAKQFFHAAYQLISERKEKEGEYSGIVSMYPGLDRYTTGFQNGELIVLGARPSVGKTAFALNLINNISLEKKIPSGLFSLEMSGRDVVTRLICVQSQIDNNKIRQNMLNDNDLLKLAKTIPRYYDAPLYLSEISSMDLFDLKVQARRMVKQSLVKIIFIDYLGLITIGYSSNTSFSGRNVIPRHEQVAFISRTLKALARELDIPIVVLVQLNRDSEGREPSLANIRDSGAVEQDADVVMFLHRKSREDEHTQLIIAKQRNGPVGSLDYYFVPRTMTFSESATRGDSSSPL